MPPEPESAKRDRLDRAEKEAQTVRKEQTETLKSLDTTMKESLKVAQEQGLEKIEVLLNGNQVPSSVTGRQFTPETGKS